jgi:glycine cleavage system aminomethyltransferase T
MAFLNITSIATTTVKSGATRFNKLVINTTAAGTITMYDSLTATGTKIGTIVASATPGTYSYDISCNIGLTIVTAAASDITVVTDEKYNP